jgi:hypothetical protein
MSASREATLAGVGTLHLSVDSDSLDSDDPYVIHGIALGTGDITVGQSGTKKLWPSDELKQAAETLEGQPLVKDHINNTDGKIGTVTHAEYIEDVGVVYEAEVAPHYDQIAKDINAGLMEVSVRAYHTPEEELPEDEETGAKIAQNVLFDNLSVVNDGAAPSNTAEGGPVDDFTEKYGTAEATATIGTDRATATLSRSKAVLEADSQIADRDVTADDMSMSLADTPSKGDAFAPDEQSIYDTKSDAEDEAEEMGCGASAHKIELDGETKYVPCSSESEYKQHLHDREVEENMQSLIEAGMQFFDTVNDNMVAVDSVTGDVATIVEPYGDAQWDEPVGKIVEKIADAEWINASGVRAVEEGMRFFSRTNDTVCVIDSIEGKIATVRTEDGEARWKEEIDNIMRKLADGVWRDANPEMEENSGRVHFAALDPRDNCEDCLSQTEQLADIDGVYEAEGTMFGIAPDEHNDDATGHPDNAKYPMTSCDGEDSVDSAWKMRGHGHYSVSQSDLEDRIRAVAEEMDCDPETVGLDEFGSQDPTGVASELEATFKQGDWVSWETRNSTEKGKVIGSYSEGDDLPDFRGSRNLSPEGDEVLYSLRMYKDEDGTWHPIEGKPIGHYEDSVSSIDEPANVSESSVELGRSNHEDYDVDEEEWVQWYPTDTTEAHGWAMTVDDDSVEIEKWDQNSNGEWKKEGSTVTKDMEEVEPWGNFPRKQEEFADEIDDGDPRKKPAQGAERQEGSEENPDGSAASEENARGFTTTELDEDDDDEPEEADIDFSDSIIQGLKNKKKEHNEEHGDEEGKKVTLSMLKKVYRRGAGAYSDSHREGMTRQQWSYARVNAFLYLVRNGNPENDAYTQDNDLLPDGHKRATENSATVPGSDDANVASMAYSSDDNTASMMTYGPDHPDVFATFEAAAERAGELGIGGVHTHKYDGKTHYMPGTSHKKYKKATGGDSSEMGMHGDGHSEEMKRHCPVCGKHGDCGCYSDMMGYMADNHGRGGHAGSMMDSGSMSQSRTVPVAQQTAPSDTDVGAEALKSILTMIEKEDISLDELSESDLDDKVVVDEDELDELAQQAEKAESVEAELSTLTDKLDEADEASEVVDELGDEEIDLITSDEDSTVVEAELAEMVDEVQGIYAEELAEHYPGMSAEDLADKFGPLELRDTFEETDAAELSTAIEQSEPEPQGGTATEEELEDEKSASDDDELDAESLEAYAEYYEAQGWDSQAAKIREGELDPRNDR